ncbi:MAG: pantoate--beta-alanine ligase [Coriobacteriia bacterium]
MVERLSSIEEVRRLVWEAKRQDKTVGFVPTMGALHEGHLSLVRAARSRCGFVVVSIFVNPTQFGPDEDFESYPRDIVRDMELLEAEGVNTVFTPSTSEMYPEGAAVMVEPGPLASRWCGEARPGHFRGVATVVAKLFNIVQPDIAFFGEKDYQQLQVIKALVRDLAYPVRIEGCPTVREPDGLAMSSRNAYLDAEERKAATALYRALCAARDAAARGERSGVALISLMEEVLDSEPLIQTEYAAVVHPETLEPLVQVGHEARALVAARVGQARLIDNMALVVGG